MSQEEQGEAIPLGPTGSPPSKQDSVDPVKELLRTFMRRDDRAKELLKLFMSLRKKRLKSGGQDLVWFHTTDLPKGMSPTGPYSYGEWLLQLHSVVSGQPRAAFEFAIISILGEERIFETSLLRNLAAVVPKSEDKHVRLITRLALWLLIHIWDVGSPIRDQLWLDDDLPETEDPRDIPKLPRGLEDLAIAKQTPEIIVFRWGWKAPQYRGDADINVWQPHHDPAPIESIRLVYLKSDSVGSERCLRTLATVKHPQVLSRLRTALLKSPLAGPGCSNNERSISSPADMLLQVLMMHFTQDVRDFTNDSRSQIRKVKLEGRRSPSGAKINYLCHLENSQEAVAHCCRDLVEQFHLLVSESRGINLLQRTLEDFETNMDFLTVEMSSNCQSIHAAKASLHEQLGLRSRWWTAVVQVLIALYVPMSFVSSFLGMNLQSSLSDTDTIIKNITTDRTINSEAAKFWDQTLYNETVSGGSVSWELKTFWEVSIPLTFGTIVIPLIAPTAFRAFIKSVHRAPTLWRRLTGFLCVALLAVQVVLTSPYITCSPYLDRACVGTGADVERFVAGMSVCLVVESLTALYISVLIWRKIKGMRRHTERRRDVAVMVGLWVWAVLCDAIVILHPFWSTIMWSMIPGYYFLSPLWFKIRQLIPFGRKERINDGGDQLI